MFSSVCVTFVFLCVSVCWCYVSRCFQVFIYCVCYFYESDSFLITGWKAKKKNIYIDKNGWGMKFIIHDECICFIFDCISVSHVTHSAPQICCHKQLFSVMIHELLACSSETGQVRVQHPLRSEIKIQSSVPLSVFQNQFTNFINCT
jgi:hypothetical protein